VEANGREKKGGVGGVLGGGTRERALNCSHSVSSGAPFFGGRFAARECVCGVWWWLFAPLLFKARKPDSSLNDSKPQAPKTREIYIISLARALSSKALKLLVASLPLPPSFSSLSMVFFFYIKSNSQNGDVGRRQARKKSDSIF